MYDLDNVVYLDRHKCYWGDFGHVRATIKAIDYIISNNISFNCFSVLTGQDYPIKTQEYMSSLLAKKRDVSYMEFFELPDERWANGGMERVDHIHSLLFGKRIVLPKRISRAIHGSLLRLKIAQQADFRFYGGSSYFTLSSKHTKYVYDFIKNNSDYVRFFKNSYISDEVFFQTILLNSPYKEEIVNDNLRLVDWSGPVDYPTIFTANDKNTIKRSKAIFARKFDVSKDAEILDYIDKVLLVRKN